MLNLNFSILGCSTTSILFVDETDYRNTPGNPLLSVKFPSLSKEYSCLIRPCEVNVINTKLLCYSSRMLDFPDGMYEFSYSIEPNEYVVRTTKYMNLANAKEKIKDLLREKDIDKELISKLYRIDLYIQASESLADVDCDKSLDYFSLINRELEKLFC